MTRRQKFAAAGAAAVVVVGIAAAVSTTSDPTASSTFSGKLTTTPVVRTVPAGAGAVSTSLVFSGGGRARLDVSGAATQATAEGMSPLTLTTSVASAGPVTVSVAGLGRLRGNMRYTLTVTVTKAPTASSTTTGSATSTAAPSSTTTTPGTADQATYVVPDQIAGDCSRDVTDELNDFLAVVPNGSATRQHVIQFRTGKCYRVDGRIGNDVWWSMPESKAGTRREYLTLDGNGSTVNGSYITSDLTQITPRYSGRANFQFTQSKGLVFENFTVVGDSTYTTTRQWVGGCILAPAGSESYYDCGGSGYIGAVEWQHGFDISESDGIVIRNNTIRNVSGDCIGLFQGNSANQTTRSVVSNTVIENNTCDGSGRHGIGVTAAEHLTIRGNTFTNIAYAVIDLEVEGHQTIRDIVIEANRVLYHRFAFVPIGGTPCSVYDNGRAYDNIVIRGNDVAKSNTTEQPVIGAHPGCGARGYNLRVENNVFHKDAQDDGDILTGLAGLGSPPIIIEQWDGLVISGNTTYRDGTGGPVIQLRDLTGQTAIERNNFGSSEALYIDAATGERDGPIPGLTACGNTVRSTPNQPRAC